MILDNGIPVVSGNEQAAAETMSRFRNYCKALGKEAQDLTEEELEEFRNLQ